MKTPMKIVAAVFIATMAIATNSHAQFYKPDFATKIYLAGGDGSSLGEKVTLHAPSLGTGASYSLTLPTTAGSNGNFLTVDGSGNLVWTSLSSVGVTSITGTAHQILVNHSTGAVTLSTPQDIDLTSTPTFGGMTLNGDLAMGTNTLTVGTINGGGSELGIGSDVNMNNHNISNIGYITLNTTSKITAPGGDVVIDNTADFNGHIVHGVNDPHDVKDAANKEYVDAAKAAITAGNGLTRTGDEIVLGGQLSGATTIDLNSNNLNLIGNGIFDNTSSNTIMNGVGIATNGLNWDGAGAGWAGIFNNSLSDGNNNGVGISLADNTTASYALWIQSDHLLLSVRADGQIDVGGNNIVNIASLAGAGLSNITLNSNVDANTHDIYNIGTLTGNGNTITVNSNVDFTGKTLVNAATINNGTGGTILIDGNADFNNHNLSKVGDVSMKAGSKISAITGDVTINSGLDMNTHQIHNVVDPSSDQDAATKYYVDHAATTAVSGTVNTMAKFTGSHAVGNSSVTDDGTTFAINTNKFTVTESNGNTTMAGTGTAAHFNSTNDYQIGGTTVLSNPGNATVAVGFGAGVNNTPGSNSAGTHNVFMGYNAANHNAAGNDNTFMGYNAGVSNVNGYANVFVGSKSGQANSGDGSGGNTYVGYAAGMNGQGNDNTGIGQNAGLTNVNGVANTFLGSKSDASASNLIFSSAIGYGAVVTSSYTMQLGSTNLQLVNTSAGITAGGSITAGTGLTVTTGGANITGNSSITGALAMGVDDAHTHLISHVSDPSDAQDAATKAYVDAAASGIHAINGLTRSGNDIKLGGTLTDANTTISTGAGKDLTVDGAGNVSINNSGNVSIGQFASNGVVHNNASGVLSSSLISDNDISVGTIGNDKLQNDAITVTPGTGLSGGGTVELGGTVSIEANIQTNTSLTGIGTSASKLALNTAHANAWTGTQSFGAQVETISTGAALTASTTDDYALGAANTAYTISCPGGISTLTSMTDGAEGRVVTIKNTGTGYIQIVDHTGPTANNQFSLVGGESVYMGPGATVNLLYIGSKWTIVSGY
jgi:hypothetical protein